MSSQEIQMMLGRSSAAAIDHRGKVLFSQDDVTAALEAGNALAMICHKIERAEDAARRIGKLSSYTLIDSEKRLERFRKKLPGPILWSQEKWDKACTEIQTLRDEVPVLTGIDSVASSPVADY